MDLCCFVKRQHLSENSQRMLWVRERWRQNERDGRNAEKYINTKQQERC